MMSIRSRVPVEKAHLQSSPWEIFKRLGRVLAEHKRTLYIALAGVFGSSLIQMALPYATKYVVDYAIPHKDNELLLKIGALLVFLQLLRAGCNFVNRYAAAMTGQQLVYQMARRLFEHVQRLSLRFYERQGTGEIISRATNDISVIQASVMGGVVNSIVGIVTMFAYGIILLTLHVGLALVVFLAVPLMIFAASKTAGILRNRFLQVQEKIAAINTVLAENISGVRVSKAFAREDEQIERFDVHNLENLRANMRTADVQSVASPAIQMIGIADMCVVIGLGAVLTIQGYVSLGTLVAFAAFLPAFFAPVEDVIRINDTIQQALAASERIFQFLDEKVEVVEKPDAISLDHVAGHVEFDHLWFEYEEGVPVLKDITVNAEPGQIIALVGHTGSGKTTLVNLIPRFYDPDRGAIRVDGHDIRDITLDTLRANIAIVLQETFLFGGTVRDNLMFGKPDASEAEMIEAAKQAHAHSFVEKLPNGYDSYVGEGGIMLSRGQRQRIALARAILRNPRILILDEATSDIDTQTEHLIQDALDRVMQGRTTFVIAHRLSTIRNADRIVVLDHGRIVQQGSHEELLQAGGKYADLYEAQFAAWTR